MIRSEAVWSVRARWWRERITLALVVLGAVAIPLVFVRDPYDMFRLPKAMFLRAEALLIVAATGAAWALGVRLPRPGRKVVLTGLAAFAGVLLLTVTSTNRALSMEALGTITATAVVFAATVWIALRHGFILLAAPLAAAVFNALLVLVEETHLWMPFGVNPEIPHHLQCNALVGNPNEIGGYLGAAALACVAALLVRKSAGLLVVAFLLIAGLIGSQTLTAIGAFVAAGLVMIAAVSWKRAVAVAGIAAVIVVILVATIAPFRQRTANISRWVRTGQYNAVFTGRLASFLTAWWMFLDRPLTGVGPGAFAWQFYDYKIRAEEEYPALRRTYRRGLNFGEVHNDHLQVLAETGATGYLFMTGLLVALGAISRRRGSEGPAVRQFAIRLALPLAVFWAVLSIAQFPLETTVVRSLLVHLAALCVGWRRP